MDVTPVAPTYGQVLVKVLCSGICGAQLQEIAGLKGNEKYLPHLMGHEGCGLVEQCGPGVTHVKTGDKVVMHWRPGAGIESELPQYQLMGTNGDRLDGRLITSGRVVTLAEYAVCSENRVTAVPTETPDELCALLGCSLSTAFGTMEEARLRPGERVMIVGCGGLGLNLILVAKLLSAGFILAIDLHPCKRTSAQYMGAHAFTTGEWNAIDERSEFDLIIDTSGDPRALEWTLRRLAPSGRYVMVGQPRPGQSVALENARHFFEGSGKSLRATQGGGFQPAWDIPRYTRLHAHGGFQLDGIISHVLPLDRVNEGLDKVRHGEAGRVLIRMEEA